jgi:hypothetical protein
MPPISTVLALPPPGAPLHASMPTGAEALLMSACLYRALATASAWVTTAL